MLKVVSGHAVDVLICRVPYQMVLHNQNRLFETL